MARYPDLRCNGWLGKPYICSEYNHSAPNEFGSETFPLICAFAALQDWDGVFAFAYSHRRDDWAKGYFPSFFDIDQHPTKMATLPASLATFLRADLAPAAAEARAVFTPAEAQEFARNRGPRISAETAGVARAERVPSADQRGARRKSQLARKARRKRGWRAGVYLGRGGTSCDNRYAEIEGRHRRDERCDL